MKSCSSKQGALSSAARTRRCWSRAAAIAGCSICRWAPPGRTHLPDSAAPSGAAATPPTRRQKSPLGPSGEEIFGAVVDPRVLRRFVAFLAPYRWIILASVGAVLPFTLPQIAAPLVIRYDTDPALPAGVAASRGEAERLLGFAVAGFFAVVAINFVSNYCQQVWVATTAERVLLDLRRAM